MTQTPPLPSPPPPPLEITCSRHCLSWLYEQSLSLAFTTYQTNRLFLIGLKPDGGLSIFERFFDRAMSNRDAVDYRKEVPDVMRLKK